MLLQQRQLMAAGQQPQQPQSTQQANQIYRTWRQSTYTGKKEDPKQVEKPTKKGDEDDLKNFFIKVAMHKDSLKTVRTLLIMIAETHRRPQTAAQLRGRYRYSLFLASEHVRDRKKGR
jgi:hypothetical protein